MMKEVKEEGCGGYFVANYENGMSMDMAMDMDGLVTLGV